MNREQSRELLFNTIAKVLSEHPDLAGDASSAINAGVSDAMRRLQEQRSASSLAMLAALSMMDRRYSESSRDMLAKLVSAAIDKNNLCPAEREFLERHHEP